MADVSITAANVKLKGSTATTRKVTYGATVTQGQPVYSDESDNNEFKPADADTLAAAAAVGIALTPGVDGDAGLIVTAGPMDVGGTLTVGTSYWVSTNAGAICLQTDLSSGDFPTYLGKATAAGTLVVNIDVGTVAKA